MFPLRTLVLLIPLILATPSYAARCGGEFNSFVASISQEAAAGGISQSVISQALGGVQQDGGVLAFDRRQRGTFNKSFEQYVSTRVGPGRINGGRATLPRPAGAVVCIQGDVNRARAEPGWTLGPGNRL